MNLKVLHVLLHRWQMYTGSRPWSGMRQAQIMSKVGTGHVQGRHRSCPSQTGQEDTYQVQPPCHMIPAGNTIVFYLASIPLQARSCLPSCAPGVACSTSCSSSHAPNPLRFPHAPNLLWFLPCTQISAVSPCTHAQVVQEKAQLQWDADVPPAYQALAQASG